MIHIFVFLFLSTCMYASDDQVNPFGMTPLHCAIENPDEVAQLIAAGACVNSTEKFFGYTPLHYACAKGQEASCKILLAHNASVTKKGLNLATPLHCAAYGGKDNIVKMLLNNRDCPIDAQDDNGQTTLMFATLQDDTKIALALIEAGASLDLKDKLHNTALHEAVRRFNLDITKQLLLHQANAKQSNLRGNTPLHVAAANGFDQMIDILIPHADINAKNGHGDTALHVASAFGRIAVIQKLIAHGADITLRNVENQDAIDLAEDDQTLQLLQTAQQNQIDTIN